MRERPFNNKSADRDERTNRLHQSRAKRSNSFKIFKGLNLKNQLNHLASDVRSTVIAMRRALTPSLSGHPLFEADRNEERFLRACAMFSLGFSVGFSVW